jgi:hypothetical protein
MINLEKANNTLRLVSGEGNLFLLEAREITKTQLPDGYTQLDNFHLLVELEGENLVLLRYDEVTINGVTFNSLAELINSIS